MRAVNEEQEQSLSDVDALASVLAKDEVLISGVRSDQWAGPTPCPEYDVRTLVNHIVGWLQVFEAAANERAFDGDAAAFTTSDPVSDFQTAAAGVVAGWRTGGVDRTVRLTGPDLPGQMVLAMTLMEYVTHGCDLSVATGQSVPFNEAELQLTLERARATLPDQYRGQGKPFGDVVEVPEDAPVLHRFLGFMGRRVGHP